MPKRRTKNPKAFTIVEMMVATVVSVIVVVGIGAVMADSHRGWNAMYQRVNSDVVADSYAAKKMFDSVIRSASKSNGFLLDAAGDWIEVYYYADANATEVNRYARFFTSNAQLNIEYGSLEPLETLSVHSVCENVQDCTFKAAGDSAQMVLALDDGSHSATIVSSAVMHNE